ncbi:MAG: hypothetical protein WBD40_00870, partial [Tepidisphaeraceae bacterium]
PVVLALVVCLDLGSWFLGTSRSAASDNIDAILRRVHHLGLCRDQEDCGVLPGTSGILPRLTQCQV